MTNKRRVGAPTKYKQEYCDALIEHMSRGLSVEAFCGVISIHKDTFYEWIKRHDEFADAKKIGICKSQYFWEVLGIQGASGRIKDFNVGSWIFNMKNRFGWTDRKDVALTSPDIKIIIDKQDEEL